MDLRAGPPELAAAAAIACAVAISAVLVIVGDRGGQPAAPPGSGPAATEARPPGPTRTPAAEPRAPTPRPGVTASVTARPTPAADTHPSATTTSTPTTNPGATPGVAARTFPADVVEPGTSIFRFATRTAPVVGSVAQGVRLEVDAQLQEQWLHLADGGWVARESVALQGGVNARDIPRAWLPAHPPTTRTGISAVDAVLAAVDRSDAGELAGLSVLRETPCYVEPVPYQFRCPPGAADRTAVGAFSFSVCHGETYDGPGLEARYRGWLRTHAADRHTSVTWLYGVYADPEGTTVLLWELDTGEARWLRIDGAGGIVTAGESCGTEPVDSIIARGRPWPAGSPVAVLLAPFPGTWMPYPGDRTGRRADISVPGSCLNLRGAPGVDSPVISCLPHGTVAEVIDGPVVADGLRWWLLAVVDPVAASGWAAEGADGAQWIVPR